MAIHFINCTEDSFKNEFPRLYRFSTLDRFFEQLDSKKISFVSPLKWNDPYEKYFLERDYRINNKQYNLAFKENVFALCFSSISNSEAYWNMYAPKCDGVRIEVSSEKFLTDFLSKIKGADVYVGPVKYYSTNDFYKKDIDTKKLSLSLNNHEEIIHQIELLYRKRNAFQYEKEIRIIIIPKRNNRRIEIVEHPYQFEQNNSKITLDPRTGNNLFKFIKANLLRNNGLRISKAKLYNQIIPSDWKLA